MQGAQVPIKVPDDVFRRQVAAYLGNRGCRARAGGSLSE
jgi:hypothetical protein